MWYVPQESLVLAGKIVENTKTVARTYRAYIDKLRSLGFLMRGRLRCQEVSRVYRGNIVVFVGPVGAGKTTHLILLEHYLRRCGLRVKRTYLKTVFILTSTVVRLSNLLRFSEKISYIVHRLSVALDLLLNVAILALLNMVRIRLASRRHNYVLVEEHLPGTLVDYVHAMLVFDLRRWFIRVLIDFLSRMLYIKNIRTIVVTCSSTSLPERWRMRGSRQERKTYIYVQRLVFDAWSRGDRGVSIVSTEGRKIIEVHREIRGLLGVGIACLRSQ